MEGNGGETLLLNENARTTETSEERGPDVFRCETHDAVTDDERITYVTDVSTLGVEVSRRRTRGTGDRVIFSPPPVD